MEMTMAPPLGGLSEIYVKYLAQCPANKEHAVSSHFSWPLPTSMCVLGLSLCLLLHEILGHAQKLQGGGCSYAQ